MLVCATAAALSLPLDGAGHQLQVQGQLVPEGVGGFAGNAQAEAASITAATGTRLFLASKEASKPTTATSEDPKVAVNAYVDRLARVLLPGVEPKLRSFLQQSVAGEAKFSVALDFGCLGQQGMSNTGADGLTRWNDPAIKCLAGGSFGTSEALHAVLGAGKTRARTLPNGDRVWHAKGIWWYGDDAWRQKYAAEAWIPQLIQKSVWYHGDRPGRPSMIMPVLFAACMEIRDHFQFCNGMPYDDNNEKSQNAFGQILDTTSMPNEDSATVFTPDWGPCMKPLDAPCEDKACQAVTKRTVLANFAERGMPDCFNTTKDVAIPTSTLVNPTDEAAKLSFVGATDFTAIAKGPDSDLHTRTRLAYFPCGHAFPERQQVYDFFKEDPDVKVVAREGHTPYLDSLSTSKFCIQADGVAAWSPRLAEFLAVGCVPVLISDRLIPPLYRTFDWPKFAVTHSIDDLAGLKARLQGLVANGTYSTMLANILLVRSAFIYDFKAQDKQISGVLPIIMFEMALLHDQRRELRRDQAESSQRASRENDEGSNSASDDAASGETLPQQNPPLPTKKRRQKQW